MSTIEQTLTAIVFDPAFDAVLAEIYVPAMAALEAARAARLALYPAQLHGISLTTQVQPTPTAVTTMRLKSGGVLEEMSGERRTLDLPQRAVAAAETLLNGAAAAKRGRKKRGKKVAAAAAAATTTIAELPGVDSFEKIAVVSMLRQMGLVRTQ